MITIDSDDDDLPSVQRKVYLDDPSGGPITIIDTSEEDEEPVAAREEAPVPAREDVMESFSEDEASDSVAPSEEAGGPSESEDEKPGESKAAERGETEEDPSIDSGEEANEKDVLEDEVEEMIVEERGPRVRERQRTLEEAGLWHPPKHSHRPAMHYDPDEDALVLMIDYGSETEVMEFRIDLFLLEYFPYLRARYDLAKRETGRGDQVVIMLQMKTPPTRAAVLAVIFFYYVYDERRDEGEQVTVERFEEIRRKEGEKYGRDVIEPLALSGDLLLEQCNVATLFGARYLLVQLAPRVLVELQRHTPPLVVLPQRDERTGLRINPQHRWALDRIAVQQRLLKPATRWALDLPRVMVPPRLLPPLVAGYGHTFLIERDGSLWCCGANRAGELGRVKRKHVLEFRRFGADFEQPVVAVACGVAHTLVLLQDGTLLGYGSNEVGQLGFGHGQGTKVADDVIAVACGRYHSAYLSSDGSLFTLGRADEGQCGIGYVRETEESEELTEKELERRIEEKEHEKMMRRQERERREKQRFRRLGDGPVRRGVMAIACGPYATIAIDRVDGAVHVTGLWREPEDLRMRARQEGEFTRLRRYGKKGVVVEEATGVLATASPQFLCVVSVIDPNGYLFVFDRKERDAGQLLVALSAGIDHLCWLDRDGAASLFGRNHDGCLGDRTALTYSVKTGKFSEETGEEKVKRVDNYHLVQPFPESRGVLACVALSVSVDDEETKRNVGEGDFRSSATLLLLANGELMATGSNDRGQLGLGTEEAVATWTRTGPPIPERERTAGGPNYRRTQYRAAGTAERARDKDEECDEYAPEQKRRCMQCLVHQARFAHRACPTLWFCSAECANKTSFRLRSVYSGK